MRWKFTVVLSCIVLFWIGCGDVESPPGSTTSTDQSITEESQHQLELDWIEQFDHTAEAVGVDEGVFAEHPSGSVSRFDSEGELLWTEPFGGDHVTGIAVDETGLYATGWGRTDLSGFPVETVVQRYSHDGEPLWTERVSGHGWRFVEARDIALNADGVHVVGQVRQSARLRPDPPEAFAMSFDRAGDKQWLEIFGGDFVVPGHPGAAAAGVAADATGIYVAGWQERQPPLDSDEEPIRDAFVRHLDAQGDVVWHHEFGSDEDDKATGVGLSEHGVHVSGVTGGEFGDEHTGGKDGFVTTLDADGGLLWVDQFGTRRDDGAQAIDAGGAGILAVGALGETAFARKYGFDGQIEQTFEFEQRFAVQARDVAVDDGLVVVAGSNFLAKLTDEVVDEPVECVQIDHDVVINERADAEFLEDIEGCFDILGHLFVRYTDDVEDLGFLSDLRLVEGYVGVARNDELMSLSGLEDLEFVGEGLVIEGNPELHRITALTSLEVVQEEIHIFGNPSLLYIDLPVLTSAGELLVAANNELLMVFAPVLVTIDQRLFIDNNDSLHTIDLRSLQQVGSVRIEANPVLTELIMPEW